MNTTPNDAIKSKKIAIVGKSSLFPATNKDNAFWPAIISLKGVLPALATREWPFGELIPDETLGKLKEFFMSSGLLSDGSLEGKVFEIPSEVLKISQVKPVLALFLAKQALESTKSYANNKIDKSKIKVTFNSTNSDSDALSQLPVKFAEKFGLEGTTLEAPFPSSKGIESLSVAFNALQSNETDLVLTGSISDLNTALSVIEASLIDRSSDLLNSTLTEGYGFTALRRFEDAKKDEDEIIAVISSTTGSSISLELPPMDSGSERGSADIKVTATPESYEAFKIAPQGNYASPLKNPGMLPLDKRQKYLEGLRYVSNASLSDVSNEESSLNRGEVSSVSWLGSKLAQMYQIPESSPELLKQVVSTEHLAQFARLHPKDIDYDFSNNSCLNLPYNPVSIEITESDGKIKVQGAPDEMLDWKKIKSCWVKSTGSNRFFHDLIGVLTGTFVNRIVFEDPMALYEATSKPVLFLANHQIGIESPLLMALSYAITGLPIQAVAKPDHVNTWLKFLMAFAEDSLGADHPFKLIFFDKTNPMGLINSLKQQETLEASVLVHVEGTRDLKAGQPVTRMSSIFLDLAIEKGITIVPVRLVGGLPLEDSGERLDFPYENGRQDYFFGKPILSEQLKAMPYGQRPKFVMEKNQFSRTSKR